jgi:membrane fusion protein (multidrug efflux system)
MRKIILSVLGVLLIVVAIMLAKNMIANKQKPKPKFNKIVKTVFVEKAQNKNIPIIITTNGNLLAKNRIEIFSEVQGVLEAEKAFKAGTHYRKGETLLRVNKDEFMASLQSQKSTLFNLITSVVPDIRLDYPKEYSKWEAYLQNFDFDKSTLSLPKFSSDKEKYFVSGKGIITSYYAVKNLEVKLDKFEIKAPYKGILTEGFVTTGTLVRVGQKLGEFIDPTVFELEVSVNASFAELLKVGNTVSLSNLDKTTNYKGKMVRVNGKVDLTSQTVKAFIELKGKHLKEGMYLEANLEAKSETNAIEIPRKLLINNTSIFTVKNDSILSLIKVNPVFFNKETVVIKGLANNSKMLTQTLPGAYDGMIVKINKKK